MKKFSKKKFIIGFLIGVVGGLFFIGNFNLISIISSILIGLIVGFLYGKFGYFVF